MKPATRVRAALDLYRELLECEISDRDAETVMRLVHGINNHLTVLPEWAQREYYDGAAALRVAIGRRQREDGAR